MNVIGELASIMGLTALAGAIIGWFSRSIFSSGSTQKKRQLAARDVDSAVRDVRHLRQTVGEREEEISSLKTRLRQTQTKDSTSESSNRAQVAEINELKKDLAASKRTLLDNQSEFNNYRTKAQKEQGQLNNELAKFKSGGSANSERLSDANETVAALRSAVRENDKVIESLRARVKEGDSTVENLRSQLKSSETGRGEIQTVSRKYDEKVEHLSKQIEQNKATVEKQKRDYDLMLETKNADIKNLHTKLEQSTTTTTTAKVREHELSKNEAGFKKEIVDLKGVIRERDTALTKARNQISDLNTQVKQVKQHEAKEVQRLQAKVDDTTKVQSQVQSTVKSKNAEVAALNDMLKDSAGKRDTLQSNLNEAKSTLAEKETRINSLQKEVDDVVASRNKVSTQLGEIQSKGNIALEKLQQDFNNLAKTRDNYKSRIDSLQTEVSDLKNAKQHDETELKETARQLNNKNQTLQSETKVLQHEVRKLDTKRTEYKSVITGLQTQVSDLTQEKDSQLKTMKAQLTTQSQDNEKKLHALNNELSSKNVALASDLKTLQSKLKDQHNSLAQQKSDIEKQIEANNRLNAQLGERDQQVSAIRDRLVREESEAQRLNSELSDAETTRLRLTEREAELRKVQIELHEASTSAGPMQSVLDEQTRKNDSLMSAMRDRDEEIARLNKQMTSNRLRSKEQESNINLLTEEKNAQVSMIKSLEVQAENTLQLHTKIAQQSTELEELRARLYERDNTTGSVASRSVTTRTTKTSHNNGLQQIETNSSRTTTENKPRVFVRSDAEALTGATGYQTAQRPQFTLDGHRIRRQDGSDDLTLLPGITQNMASAFSRQGVADFEQISLWTDREVNHYAERIGVPVQKAQQFNWPKAARSILNGSYRKDSQEIGH